MSSSYLNGKPPHAVYFTSFSEKTFRCCQLYQSGETLDNCLNIFLPFFSTFTSVLILWYPLYSHSVDFTWLESTNFSTSSSDLIFQYRLCLTWPDFLIQLVWIQLDPIRMVYWTQTGLTWPFFLIQIIQIKLNPILLYCKTWLVLTWSLYRLFRRWWCEYFLHQGLSLLWLPLLGWCPPPLWAEFFIWIWTKPHLPSL